MEIYFDVLPEEVNFLILFNLTPEEIYYFKEIFPHIDNNKFWYSKISYDFPWTNMEFVPQCFYNYARKSLPYIQYQYNFFKYSYESAIYILNERKLYREEYINYKKENPNDENVEYEHNVAYTYKFDTVNNIDVLAIWDKISIDDINNLVLHITEYYKIEFILYGNGRCKVTIYAYATRNNNITYDVSIKELFNIILHIYLNGGELV